MNHSRAAAHEWLGTKSTATANDKITSAITTNRFIAITLTCFRLLFLA